MTDEGMAFCGAHVLIKIGSGVQILTTDHPRDPALRRQDCESGISVRIGETIWIGSGAIIGSGSVMRRNVPVGAIAMGNLVRLPNSRKPIISILLTKDPYWHLLW